MSVLKVKGPATGQWVNVSGSSGPAGPGVIPGGLTGQHLAKRTDLDYECEWVDPTASGVTPTGVHGIYTSHAGPLVQSTDLKTPITGEPVGTYFVGTDIIPAFYMTLGMTIRIKGYGFYSSEAVPMVGNLSVNWGPTELGFFTFNLPANMVDQKWSSELVIVCGAVGGGAWMASIGQAMITTGSGSPAVIIPWTNAPGSSLSQIGVNVSVDSRLCSFFKWDVASTQNKWRITTFSYECIPPP